MANQLAFEPRKTDPRIELRRRLEAAPDEHAEALLVAYDVLQEAHDQGILDAVHGALRAKDTIIGEVARYAADPAALNALRHVIAVGKMVGSFNPEPISNMAREAYRAMEDRKRPEKPPTLWQLFRRMTHEDTRRGLSFLTTMLQALGRATR